MSYSESLTATGLLAKATEELTLGGYTQVHESVVPDGSPPMLRFFEDKHGIVGVSVHETWSSLKTSWARDQSWLIDLISAHTTKSEAKAWDGYLVLMTPGIAGSEERAALEEIRYNMTRVRKFVATGDELASIEDVRRALLPILPIVPGEIGVQADEILDRLPDLISTETIPREALEALVSAFHKNEGLMQSLHSYLAGGANETS